MWSDQVGGAPRYVQDAAALMPDPRARHYWDADRDIGRAYRVLKTDTATIDLETKRGIRTFSSIATPSGTPPGRRDYGGSTSPCAATEPCLSRRAGKAAALRANS